MKICFLNGPNKNKEFLVKKDLILTRNDETKGSIFIDDSKASNPHAQIIQKQNTFYIQDLDSRNGIYVNEKKKEKFALKVGLEFAIGKTLFQVKEVLVTKIWSEEVIKTLKNLSFEDKPKDVQVFKKALKLSFKSGVQKGEKWHLYYGPRKVGAYCFDLPILEPKAPGVCFLLEPKEEFILFKTRYPEKILINKKHISKKKLSNGDIISFAKTFIEVEYIQDEKSYSKKKT